MPALVDVGSLDAECLALSRNLGLEVAQRSLGEWASPSACKPAGLRPADPCFGANAALSSDLASDATTPDLVFISANDAHNMHTGSIAAGDSWLQANLAAVLASPAWTAHNSLLVITWDEDDGSEGNRVLTLLLGPSVRPAFSSATATPTTRCCAPSRRPGAWPR